jgi:thiosulfate reductase/polysulfide reductase chain A
MYRFRFMVTDKIICGACPRQTKARFVMSISRRDFLKFTTAGAAGTAVTLAGSELMSPAEAMAPRPKGEATYIPTYCEMCFWNCGAIARVVNGRLEKLEGNPLHPRSRGKLCARGNGGVSQLYDEERLKHPMIRTGKRGDGQYRKATWDEALDHIATKLAEIEGKHGRESVAFMLHGGITKFMMQLGRAYGTPNFAFPSYAQCRGARVVAYELTYGTDIGSPERVDLANARVIALFGTHLGENMHNSQVQDWSEAIGRGAKIIVADPRFSTAAGKAHYWLPLKPGSDMALALAWTNIIIKEGWYDRDYVAKYTTGFEKLRDEVRQYTPEWAARETEISPKVIVETARELGRYAPSVVVHPGRYTSWHGNDTQRVRSLAILGAILGTWGRKGGVYLSTDDRLPMPKSKPNPRPERPPLTKGPHAFAHAELMQAVRYATLAGKPYPIKAWFVAGTNVLKSVPGPEKTLKAMEKLDLLVAIDIMPYDTVMMADVILPESTYLERHDGLQIAKGASLSVSIRQPVVEPMYESKPGWWIAKALGERLGLGEHFPYDTYEEYIKMQCKVMGVDYDRLKTDGTVVMPGTADPYITASNQPKFKTPSGKIELYSERLKRGGFDPIPKYKAIEQPSKGAYRLIMGRSPVHTFSRTTDNQLLWELFRENELWINAEEAKRLGVRNGQYVVLVNQDGIKSSRIRARVTERIRKDCVYMVHGFGSKSKSLRQSYNKGADDNRLFSRFNVDPISGATGMRVNFVKIEKEA